MDLSRLQILNDYLLIATAVALSYLVTAWLIIRFVRLIRQYRRNRSVDCRPGELVHQGLKVTGRLWELYRTAFLLFAVTFIVLMYFGRLDIFSERPLFLNCLLLLCLLPPLLLAFLKCVQLVRYRHRLDSLLDQHTQIAQRLIEVQIRGNRVFPSLRLDDFMIDNVVVGGNGVYALQLFTASPEVEAVSYEHGALIFQPGGHRVSLRSYLRQVETLSSRLSNEISARVDIVPVVVVPECRIEGQQGKGPVLVSLQTCSSFIGFRHNDFFLHQEDIARVSVWLEQQHLEDPPGTLRTAIGALQRQIEWPALVRS
ncbi:MAG: hypothetical protein ACR2QG_06065 [Gammaproteobacteria bacterium]